MVPIIKLTPSVSILGPIGPSDVGDVIEYGSNIPPMGWMVCDGSAVSRTTYPQLFATIGTTYGVGDGSTTFNLPGPGIIPVLASDSRLSDARTPIAHAASHGSFAADKLPYIDNAGTSAVNITQDCTGACNVRYVLTYTAALTLTFTHLGPCVPVFIRAYNNSGASTVLKIAATTPLGAAWAVSCVVVSLGAEIDLTTSGISMGNQVVFSFWGMAGGADGRLSFIGL